MFFVSQKQAQGSFSQLRNLVLLLGLSSLVALPPADAKIFYATSANGATYGCSPNKNGGYWATMNTVGGQVTPGASLSAGFQVPQDVVNNVNSQIRKDPQYKNKCHYCSSVQQGAPKKGGYTPPNTGGQSRFGQGTGSALGNYAQQEAAYDRLRQQMSQNQGNRNQ
jgi:hypothetical protein